LKIALIAPPFISVPPADYGGTELFIAQLGEGLQEAGAEVVVYANGQSRVNVERRWIYDKSQWPIKMESNAWMKELNHQSWAIRDAAKNCDIVHLHSPQAICFSRFIEQPVLLTLHGHHQPHLSELYAHYPEVHYICISDFQRRQESMPRLRTIYHGIDLKQYRFSEKKKPYLSFIGRIAPIKGTHLAIDVAKRTGIPLKIAGDVQPAYSDYFEAKIKPEIDGRLVEYIGTADLKAKNELLCNSMAMLFPIQWNEPFGLVMVESMACGTPVLAMPGGSVPEVVRDGVSGYICRSVVSMAKRLKDLSLKPRAIRQYVEQNFSLQHMVGNYLSMYEQAVSMGGASEEKVRILKRRAR
jgi:glycosyltransferase involved in cell wall biosynthesis